MRSVINPRFVRAFLYALSSRCPENNVEAVPPSAKGRYIRPACHSLRPYISMKSVERLAVRVEYTAYISPQARTTTALSFLNRILRARKGLGIRQALALDLVSA